MTSVLVAVPTLGTRPDWLRVCLGSLQAQQVDGLQVVVVGPTGSPAEGQAAASGFEYSSLDRPGLSVAINHVWRTHAEHDFLAWLGDDDGLAPGSLRATIRYLDRHPSDAFVYGWCRFVAEDGATLHVTRPGRISTHWLRWGNDRVPQIGALFRASCVDEIGGLDESLRYAMDYDLFLRLRATGGFGYLRQELGFYRQHGKAISYNKGDDGDEANFVRRRAQSRPIRTVASRLSGPLGFADRLHGMAVRHWPKTPIPRWPSGSDYVNGL